MAREKRTNSLPHGASQPLGGFTAAQIGKSLEKTTQIGKFHTKGGTGFAAEDGNAMADRLRLRKVEVCGVNNAANGADRLVYGVPIQTKYFAAAKDTLQAAFDPATGSYRYGGQMLEVPADQYEECLGLLREKISQGKVPGVGAPEEAEGILRRGAVTYRQARNIARAGNINSLLYDAQTQAVTCTYVFAVSFVVDYAQRRCGGRDSRAAINDSLATALAAGSKSLVTGIVSAQLLRSQAARTGTVLVRQGLQGIYQTAVGKTVIEHVAAGSLGKVVHGAAALNRVSKLVRSNTLTSAVTMVVVTTPDFYRAAFERTISWEQFTKNLLVNAAGLAAGVGGWMAGAGIGAAIGSAVPLIGTAAGGIIGGLLGAVGIGMGGQGLAKSGLDCLVEDDAKRMLALVQEAAQEVACDHLLLDAEFAALVEFLQATVTAEWLRHMFQAGASGGGPAASREFAYSVFAERCESLLTARPKVVLPRPTTVARRISGVVQRSLRREGERPQRRKATRAGKRRGRAARATESCKL